MKRKKRIETFYSFPHPNPDNEQTIVLDEKRICGQIIPPQRKMIVLADVLVSEREIGGIDEMIAFYSDQLKGSREPTH